MAAVLDMLFGGMVCPGEHPHPRLVQKGKGEGESRYEKRKLSKALMTRTNSKKEDRTTRKCSIQKETQRRGAHGSRACAQPWQPSPMGGCFALGIAPMIQTHHASLHPNECPRHTREQRPGLDIV